MEISFYSVIFCLAKSVAFGKALHAVPKPSHIKVPCKKKCIEPNLVDETGRPSVVYSLDYLINTVSGLQKIKTMTCIKKGLSELALNRPRPSIMKVKSALPTPPFRLFLNFTFLRVLNCSCYILLSHLARTIFGSCVNDLLLSSLRYALFLRKKNKPSAPSLGLLRIRPVKFLGGISLDFCF